MAKRRIRAGETRPEPNANNHGGKREKRKILRKRPPKKTRKSGRNVNGKPDACERLDGRWQSKILANGIRKAFTAKTRTEAIKKATEWLASPAAKDPNALKGAKTVGDSLKAMLKRYKSGAERGDKGRSWGTYEALRNATETHLIPRIGSCDAAKITSREIQALYDDMIDDGVGGALMEQCHKALRAAFCVLRPDLMALIKKPSYAARKWTIWSPAQVNQFLAYCDKTKHKWAALFRLALRTGCRLGELLALTAADFDRNARCIRIDKTWDTHKCRTQMWPKTDGSIRSVKLTADAYDALCKYVDAKRPRSRPDWRMFPVSNLGWFRNDFRATAEAAKVPVLQRPHDMRHTFATNGLLATAPVADLARMGGWKKPSLLLNLYGNHIDDGSQDLTIERLERLA
jgi:site-specific recombinase XerD